MYSFYLSITITPILSDYVVVTLALGTPSNSLSFTNTRILFIVFINLALKSLDGLVGILNKGILFCFANLFL